MVTVGLREMLFAAALVGSAAVVAGMKTEIRFYKANKYLQQDRIALVAGTDEPGCHNFLLTTRIYRAAQIGFQTCALYAEKDCPAGSELPVRWKQKEKPVTEFTQGARWFPDGERGAEVRSWRCVALPARGTEAGK